MLCMLYMHMHILKVGLSLRHIKNTTPSTPCAGLLHLKNNHTKSDLKRQSLRLFKERPEQQEHQEEDE